MMIERDGSKGVAQGAPRHLQDENLIRRMPVKSSPLASADRPYGKKSKK
jgi:hypothetical protein